jgi:hypothetical protein
MMFYCPFMGSKSCHIYHNFTFRFIDDALSLNISRFGDFVDRIYLTELEIKDTTDIASALSLMPWLIPYTVRVG